MYCLEYLPIARKDMIDIASYISHELNNPTAAERLANEMIEATDRITTFPYQNRIHPTIRPLQREYRKLLVQNYIMFYWIDEESRTITIARVLYARRDYEKLL